MATKLLVVTLLLASLLSTTTACTTLAVGKKASADGSVFATHSDDGGGSLDGRLVRIPGRSYPEGTQRPVYYSPEVYPRFVGPDRADEYLPLPGQTSMTPIGWIPQVNQTYSYFEATYGVINEKKVGVGESTCSSVYATGSISQGGAALMSVDTLVQLAMERSSSSRAAVQLMGDFAVQYGFYGEGGFEGGAESLMVIDGDEAFVLHILADESGKSAIWCAQRVPDDGVAVVANMFVISVVLFNSTEFLYSANIVEEAKKLGWDGVSPLDFTKIFSDGEYGHKYYSGRRVWRAFSMVAPSLNLPAEYDDLKDDDPYPFSVVPDEPVTLDKALAIMRDHMEGTPYDLANGMASGPWNTPTRYAGNVNEAKVGGSWERSIGLFRTSSSHVVQSRSWLNDDIGGTVWFGPHASYSTIYVPFTSGMTKTSIPEEYSTGSPSTFDRKSAYMAHRYLSQIVELKFSYAIKIVQEAARVFEEKAREMQLKASNLSLEEITEIYSEHALGVVHAVWALSDKIVFTFSDGYVYADSKADGATVRTTPGYPEWWLEAVGFSDGPGPV